jgi:hypothetical protein
MFFALRTQQITDTSAERQLLQFYTKKDRTSYLEARGDATIIKAKEAYKFSFREPGYPVRSPETGNIFFAHTIY